MNADAFTMFIQQYISRFINLLLFIIIIIDTGVLLNNYLAERRFCYSNIPRVRTPSRLAEPRQTGHRVLEFRSDSSLSSMRWTRVCGVTASNTIQECRTTISRWARTSFRAATQWPIVPNEKCSRRANNRQGKTIYFYRVLYILFTKNHREILLCLSWNYRGIIVYTRIPEFLQHLCTRVVHFANIVNIFPTLTVHHIPSIQQPLIFLAMKNIKELNTFHGFPIDKALVFFQINEATPAERDTLWLFHEHVNDRYCSIVEIPAYRNIRGFSGELDVR